MSLQHASVTVAGRVAANVTELLVDGTAVSVDEQGGYRISVDVDTTDRVIVLRTTTATGRVETRFLSVRRDLLPPPSAEG